MAGKGLRQDRVFMRVLMDGDDNKMMLPPSISKELDRVRSRTATLQSQLGCWEVKIERKTSDGRLYIGKGWSEFVECHPMQRMSFLQFKHIGGMVLQVTIIKIEGEEEMCNTGGHNLEDSVAILKGKDYAAASGSTAGQVEAIPTAGANLQFAEQRAAHIIQIGKGTTGQVAIGRHFVRQTNLYRRDNVKLISNDGEEFQIRIRKYKHPDGQPIVMFGKGWSRLYDRYNLNKGDGVKLEVHCEGPEGPAEIAFEVVR